MSSTVQSAMPSIEWASRIQLLTARYCKVPAAVFSPSTTVQAPQSPSLQPSLVPLQPRSSRTNSSKVRDGRTPSTWTISPRRTKRNARPVAEIAALVVERAGEESSFKAEVAVIVIGVTLGQNSSKGNQWFDSLQLPCMNLAQSRHRLFSELLQPALHQ